MVSILAQNSKLKSQNNNLKVKTTIKHRAYYFSIRVIKFTSTLPSEKVFWVITDQLLKASTSIGANIVEAQSASSKRDFIKFYEIALKSANETKYWICLLRDSGVLKNIDKVKSLLQETVEIANILGSSIITLKGKRKF